MKNLFRLTAISLLLLAVCLPMQARSQRSFTSLLREAVIKVSFNEALDSTHDGALIWQIVQAKGETDAERYFWLRSHSPCATGVLSQDQAYRRQGNCQWVRNLSPRQVRLPRGYTAPSGFWSSNTRPRWHAHVAYMSELLRSEDPYRPCDETPTSWDGVRYGRECIERGEDCPAVVSNGAAARWARNPRRVLDCAVPYTSEPGAEGLHNFAVAGPERGSS